MEAVGEEAREVGGGLSAGAVAGIDVQRGVAFKDGRGQRLVIARGLEAAGRGSGVGDL